MRTLRRVRRAPTASLCSRDDTTADSSVDASNPLPLWDCQRSTHSLAACSRVCATQCGQVVCSDCSRVRATPPRHLREAGREVRVCVECSCEMQCVHESLSLAPPRDFVQQQLTHTTVSSEKLKIAVQLASLQAKMRVKGQSPAGLLEGQKTWR